MSIAFVASGPLPSPFSSSTEDRIRAESHRNTARSPTLLTFSRIGSTTSYEFQLTALKTLECDIRTNNSYAIRRVDNVGPMVYSVIRILYLPPLGATRRLCSKALTLSRSVWKSLILVSAMCRCDDCINVCNIRCLAVRLIIRYSGSLLSNTAIMGKA